MIHKETSKTIIVWKSLSWENNEKFPIVFFHIFFFFFSVWMANDDDDGETKAWGRRESEAETELSSVNSVNIETERDRQEQESVIISSLLIPVSSNDRKKMCHWEWRRNEIKTIISTDDWRRWWWEWRRFMNLCPTDWYYSLGKFSFKSLPWKK